MVLALCTLRILNDLYKPNPQTLPKPKQELRLRGVERQLWSQRRRQPPAATAAALFSGAAALFSGAAALFTGASDAAEDAAAAGGASTASSAAAAAAAAAAAVGVSQLHLPAGILPLAAGGSNGAPAALRTA